MKTLNVCFVISVLFIQSVFGFEFPAKKSICDSREMDRIVLSVVQNSQPNYQKAANKEDESWRRQHPVAFGSLVGFGIGFGYSVLVATGGDVNFFGAVLVFGGIGAGIGALIGSFF